MISKSISFACTILTVHALLHSSSVFGQDLNRPQYEVISFPASDSVNELYVAVMGEIKKPGTYHVDPASLKLHSVIQRSGGFTSDASKVIRLIRRGQSSSHKIIYSDVADNPLMSGDLLIVDSKQLMSNSSKVVDVDREEPVTIRANFEEPVEDTSIQVALLNLLDYPVIIQVRPEESSPSHIMQWLGQPITLLEHTRVMTSEVRPRPAPNAGKPPVRLNDGTVLVFEPGQVNRKRLPSNLPKPIESDIAAGARTGLIGMPNGQSTELRGLGQGIFSSAFDGSSVSLEPPAPSQHQQFVPVRENADREQNEEMAEPTVTSKPRIATVPWTGNSKITNSSTATSRSSESSKNGPIPEPDDAKDETSFAPLPTAAALTMNETTEEPQRAFSMAQLSITFLIAGILIGTALLVRRTLERKSSRQAFSLPIVPLAPAPASAVTIEQTSQPIVTKSLLEKLLKNDLPVTIEDFELPSGINLQGQIVAKSVLRLDGAQNILKQNGPHFPAAEHSGDGSILRDVIAQVDAPEPNSIRRPHFISTRQQKIAPSAVTVETTAKPEHDAGNDRSRAPLAKALFQLEKGGRS